MDNKRNDKLNSNIMGRRQFLTLSSLAVLTPISARAERLSLSEDSASLARPSVFDNNEMATISIGYWPGGQPQPSDMYSDNLPENDIPFEQTQIGSQALSLKESTQEEERLTELLNTVKENLSSRVVSAETISPDKNLKGRDVQVTVHSLALAKTGGHLSEWLLDALYPIKGDEGMVEVPFHAWNYKDDLSTPDDLSAVFSAPVHPDGGLTFQSTRTIKRDEGIMLRLLNSVVAGRAANMEQCDMANCNLSVSSSDHGPKLREGTYLIGGPSYSSGKLPQWEQYAFIEDSEKSDTARGLYRRTLAGLAPVDFDYVMVSISAA